MQSITEGKPGISVRQIASTARRREEIRATLKADMTGGAALGILGLLFLVCLAYAAFGGRLEASSTLTPEASIAWLLARPADTGGAPRNEQASGENFVVRCDKAAVVDANQIHEHGDHGRAWRRERQLAFQRCVDELFQSLQEQRS